ncbi:palmitoyl-protein thioesterase 1 [Plasmopara halstedii]|uniref:Palmitoyl-protein thioesterase 1 n=1 Tax=Plasmopara halstedii TaxID=4781 RepID=A0A0P1AFL1_PLAHL|nr:palmitoyl-protein thioesterase 1 [Plasmopara halstedii]CEG39210.1 palmitoyl-protein thioesterase 1 [Plasmopara halstedii]|eukprot:XP_024575579.1 palmitoyl-protein thioesterase 1 [Plasmopara halstedii]
MTRSSISKPLLVVVVATIALVLVQFVLIKNESVWYIEGETSKHIAVDETLQLNVGRKKTPVFRQSTMLPVVLMHGMGDAAGNRGMKRIQSEISKHLQVYVASVQLGNSVADDIQNSFFLTMDNQTEMFAKIVREDPRLANGFNAAGFSQGNLVIRAYIERFNDPPVHTFISFHGPLAGVGGLPRCSPLNFICKEIDELIGEAVYTKRVQERIAQANYFRDPLRIDVYLKHAKFLPDLNNEKTSTNQTYKENFIKLQNLVLVRASEDTQVYPKESEWFGMYRDDDPYKHVLGFNETRWYQDDLFGLKTLDQAGKVHLLSSNGDHLQFSVEFLLGVVDKYFHPLISNQIKVQALPRRRCARSPFLNYTIRRYHDKQFECLHDNNLNDALKPGDNEREEMEVDARVWDRELGYFVYPADKKGVKLSAVSNLENRTDSGSKLLLTPSMMLSSRTPDSLISIAANGDLARVIADDTSNTTKRGLKKQTNRSTTPGRRRRDKEGAEELCLSKSVPDSLKNMKSKSGGNTATSGMANPPQRIVKQKEQLSASGKWAWSAFQSSPDPTELPMPPFLTKPQESFISVAEAPILPRPHAQLPSQATKVLIAPPLPPGPPISLPPRPPAPPEIASSIESSMTQDLRRMLNISGG